MRKSETKKVTYEEVSVLLNYDPLTGVLTWKVSRGGSRAGDVAGSVGGNGYISVRVEGSLFQAHRIAFLLTARRWPKDQIDHINHDGLDNRWENLREVTHAENGKNQSRKTNNTSGTTGVVWHRASGKWQARIKARGIRKHLGIFAEIEDAITARKAAEIKYGFHPNHGRNI